MKIKQSKYELTAVHPNQFPENDMMDVVFVGKSNVGKSSIINMLLNRKNLARVGNAPGKTRVINFYNVDDRFYFVDLPGYGYAKVSKEMRNSWGKMIEGYFNQRKKTVLVILLIDIRHEPGENDRLMHDWIAHYGYPYIVAASKADKIKKSQLEKHLQTIRDGLELEPQIPILPFSALKKTGGEELWKYIAASIEGE